MDITQPEKTFIRQIVQALRHLYEPMELRKSPLVSILNINPGDDVPTELRGRLLEAIHSLKPDPRVPPEANSWRYYKILCTRFEEQFSQEEVASQLAISPRHVRRLEYAAIQALAKLLIENYQITLPYASPEKPGVITHLIESANESTELEWMKRSYLQETTDIKGLIDSILNTSKTLLSSTKASVSVSAPPDLPLIIGQVTILRQVILNLLVAAAKTCPQSAIQLIADSVRGEISITIQSKTSCQGNVVQEDASELIQSARSLVEVSGGKLHLNADADASIFSATIILPSIEKIPILFVDDNEDSLQLFMRYLENTRYQYHFTRDSSSVLETAVKTQARVIVLDIMLPDIDGWELLGRIRAHPDMETIPVIVSTILPQEQLAYSLGAVGFIQKPVSREGLLAKLDQVLRP